MMSDKRGGGRLSNLPRKLRYIEAALLAADVIVVNKKMILLFGKQSALPVSQGQVGFMIKFVRKYTCNLL